MDKYTLKESTVRKLATRIILRRLMIGDGNCQISVRSVARNLAREIEGCPDSNFPAWIYTTVDTLLERFGGEIWGEESRHGKSHDSPIPPYSKRIYQFTR
jgi:hypothetical protein